MNSQYNASPTRDLKYNNTMSNAPIEIPPIQQLRFKLCDFGSTTAQIFLGGSAQEINLMSEEISRLTTPQYRAPEMVDLYSKGGIGVGVDVWALGCLLYKLCWGVSIP